MNFSAITEQSFLSRYETAPDEIRDALDSEEARTSLTRLAKAHYLSPEKAEMLENLTGLVLLGYVAPRDLAREIGEHLFLNHEHSRILANEVEQRVFEPILEEIEGFYQPLETAEPEEEIKVEAQEGEEDGNPVSVKLKEGGEPLVLHEEPSFFAPKKDEKKPRKPFLPFFATSPESETKSPVKAKIETPLGSFFAPKQEKDEEKVIHYSELRSSVAPEEPLAESFINLEALEKARSPEKALTQETQAPRTPVPISPEAEKAKPQETTFTINLGEALTRREGPELEGNTVRLK